MAGARIFVCRSIIGIGPRTAGLIGIWEALFDLPEQRKDYGDDFRVTSGLWHVRYCKLLQKYLAKPVDQNNGRIRHKLGVPIATTRAAESESRPQLESVGVDRFARSQSLSWSR